VQIVSCKSSQVWEGLGLGTRYRLDKDEILVRKEWRVEKPKRQSLKFEGENGGAWGTWVSSLFADEERDRCLGCCGLDILIWRWQTGDLLIFLARLHDQPITACWLTPDMHLITCSRDNLVKVWQYCSGFEQAHAFKPGAASSDPLSLLSGSRSRRSSALGTVQRRKPSVRPPPAAPAVSSPVSAAGQPSQLDMGPASPAPSSPVSATARLLRQPSSSSISSMTFSLPAQQPRLLETFAGHDRGVFGAAVDPATGCLFTFGDDGVLCCWNMRRCRKVSAYTVGPAAPSFLSLALDSSGKTTSLFVSARKHGNIASGTVQVVALADRPGAGSGLGLVAVHGTELHLVRVTHHLLSLAEALGPVHSLHVHQPAPDMPHAPTTAASGAEGGDVVAVLQVRRPGPRKAATSHRTADSPLHLRRLRYLLIFSDPTSNARGARCLSLSSLVQRRHSPRITAPTRASSGSVQRCS
jgi:hypothetical protein